MILRLVFLILFTETLDLKYSIVRDTRLKGHIYDRRSLAEKFCGLKNSGISHHQHLSAWLTHNSFQCKHASSEKITIPENEF